MFGLESEGDLEFFCKLGKRGAIPLSEISPKEMISMYYWIDVGNVCLKEKIGSTTNVEDDSLLALTSKGKRQYQLLEEFMIFLTSYKD